MTEDEFWAIIERVKSLAASKSQDEHAEILVDEVAKLSIDEIMEYDLIHRKMMYRAYDPLLWDAAGIMAGGWGCTDDGFTDFRGWLIAQGKAIYEAALDDPETLVDTIEIGIDAQDQDFAYIAYSAYEKKTGSRDDFNDHALDHSQYYDPRSQDMKFLTNDEARIRFPKLYAKFWGQWKLDFDWDSDEDDDQA